MTGSLGHAEMETQRVTLAMQQARVIDLCAKDGSRVSRGAPIVRLEHEVPDDPGARSRYAPYYTVNAESGTLIVRDIQKTPYAGILRISLKEGQYLRQGADVFSIIEACGHSVQFSGMCALCGIDLRLDYASDGGITTQRANISMVHDTSGIRVSVNKARELDKETSQRLLRDKKLSLILDLDQTLIHATADSNVGVWMDLEENALAAEMKGPSEEPCEDSSGSADSTVNDAKLDEHTAKSNTTATAPKPSQLQGLFRFRLAEDPHEYFLRLRPHLREFLDGVSSIFELHIYTMGSRLYANQVAKLIDPSGQYFQDRILSRDESGSCSRKSLERLFPCDQSMVVAIDDRGDVWEWADNLIRVHPYSYFLRTGDINAPIGVRDAPLLPGLPGPTVISSPPSTDNTQHTITSNMRSNVQCPLRLHDDDKELKILLNILRQLHQTFFSTPSADVRIILPNMKRQVLADCELVFSGVVPKHVPETDSDPWKLAKSFGARCATSVSPATTHVVATRWGTHKTKEGRALGITLVKPSWLLTSIAYWKRQDETRFLLACDEEEDDDIDENQGDQDDGDDEDEDLQSILGDNSKCSTNASADFPEKPLVKGDEERKTELATDEKLVQAELKRELELLDENSVDLAQGMEDLEEEFLQWMQDEDEQGSNSSVVEDKEPAHDIPPESDFFDFHAKKRRRPNDWSNEQGEDQVVSPHTSLERDALDHKRTKSAAFDSLSLDSQDDSLFDLAHDLDAELDENSSSEEDLS